MCGRIMTGRVSIAISGKVRDKIQELIDNEPKLFMFETVNGFCNYAIKKILDDEIERINLYYRLSREARKQ